MKKLLLLTCFLFLTSIFIPTVYAQDDYYGEDFSNVDVEDPFSGEGSASLDDIIDDLDSLHQDLSDELSDTPNKALRDITRKIQRSIDLLDKAVEASDDGDLDVCDINLSRGYKLINKTVNQFEAKECSGRATRNCISTDILDVYLGDLEDIADSLDEELSIDDDEDDIPDICGFSE